MMYLHDYGHLRSFSLFFPLYSLALDSSTITLAIMITLLCQNSACNHLASQKQISKYFTILVVSIINICEISALARKKRKK